MQNDSRNGSSLIHVQFNFIHLNSSFPCEMSLNFLCVVDNVDANMEQFSRKAELLCKYRIAQ